MANELVLNYPTGATLYALVFNAVGQIYNGSTFETPAAANWANYDIAATEIATTGIYRATMPGVAAGAYGFTFRLQAGGSPAVGDITVGTGKIEWDGSAEQELYLAPVDAVAISGDTTAANNAESFFDGTGYAGTGNTIPTVTTVGTVTALANNAITAAAIATAAIDADALATDAVSEIADGVWDEARAGHTTGGTFGEGVSSVQGNVTGNVSGSVGSVTGAVGSVTGSVGGNVVGSVGSVVGAVASVTGNVNGSVGSVVGNVGGNVAGSVASVTGAVGSVTAVGSGAISSASFAAGAITAAAIADNAIDAATLAADLDTYQCKTGLVDDDGASRDRYVAIFFENSQPITAGITSPQIQVIKAADGADLIAPTALTQIASTGLWRHDEASNRVVNGAAYVIVITATIAGSSRTWYQWVGRDT